MSEPLLPVVGSCSHPVEWNVHQMDSTGSCTENPPADEIDCDCSSERVCTIFPHWARTGCHVIFLLFCLLVSASMMTAGILYRDACHREPGIVIYLIVCGAMLLLKTVLHLLLFVKRWKDPEPYEGHALVRLDSVLNCFLVCWIAVGSVWIYSLFGKIMSHDLHIRASCNKTFYTVAFCVQSVVCGSGLLALAILCPIYVRSCVKT